MGTGKSIIKEVLWQDVRLEVKRLNPALAKAIDQVNPDKSHKLFKVTYPYGFEMMHKGQLKFPDTQGSSISVDELAVSMKAELNYYQGSPVCMVLTKAVELYLNAKDRVMTYGCYNAGNIIGLVRLFNGDTSYAVNSSLWGMSAGARSTFMLPKISEEGGHARLKDRYQLKLFKPTTLFDHWEMFKAIANSTVQEDAWQVEMLFFGKKWFEHTEDAAWHHFNYYLLDLAWKKTAYWRNQYFLNTIASILQDEKQIKLSLYTMELVMHLIAIGLGEVPGFRVAHDDRLIPLGLIQKAYLDVYNLKGYAPLVMEPSYFSLLTDQEQPIYYSLNYPTSLYFSPKNSKKSSTLHDLYDVGRNLKKYLDQLLHVDLGIKDSPLYYLAKHCKFDLYHNNIENYSNILESKDIENVDPNFMWGWEAREDLLFPKSSAFFNGCIMISKT